MEETVKVLLNENESHIKKEVMQYKFYIQKIDHRVFCKVYWDLLLNLYCIQIVLLVQATLEDTIKQLQQKYHSYVQKEVDVNLHACSGIFQLYYNISCFGFYAYCKVDVKISTSK